MSDKLSDEEMATAMSGLNDIWNAAEGLALQHPEEKLPDLAGEIASLNIRLYNHEKEGLDHENIISDLSVRIGKLGTMIQQLAETGRRGNG